MQDQLGLDRNQLAFLRTMPPQTLIVKTPGITPFPLHTNPLSLNFDIDIEEWNKTVLRKYPELEILQFKPEKENKGTREPSDYRVFMEAIARLPGLPVTKYFPELKDYYGSEKAFKISQEIRSRGDVREQRIYDGRHHFTALQITELGEKRYELSRLVHFRGSGYEHTVLGLITQRHLQSKGQEVKREHYIGNHPCDLFSEGVAYEITCKNKPAEEARGILADLKEAQSVVCISNDKKQLQRIEALLSEPDRSKVEFRLLCEFIKAKRKKVNK